MDIEINLQDHPDLEIPEAIEEWTRLTIHNEPGPVIQVIKAQPLPDK